jgi:tetratricopeptide (TPR) repeat protein
MEKKSESALDQVVWSHIVKMVQAAHGLGRVGYIDQVNEFARYDTPRQRVAWLYVWFILRHTVGEVLQGGAPSDEDLERISRDYVNPFRALVGFGQPTFEDLLRIAWLRDPGVKKLSFGEQVVFGCAAIGILLQNPEHTLDLVKPQLNEWWLENSDHYRRRGLIPDEPPGEVGEEDNGPAGPGNSIDQTVEAPEQRSQLAPDLLASQVRHVHALAADSGFDDAARAAEQALALDPNSALLRQVLALARYMAGDLTGAREAILAALGDSPDRDFLQLLEKHIREDGVEAELADVYDMIQVALDTGADPQAHG